MTGTKPERGHRFFPHPARIRARARPTGAAREGAGRVQALPPEGGRTPGGGP